MRDKAILFCYLCKLDKDSCSPLIRADLTQFYHHLNYKYFVLTMFLAQVHHPLSYPEAKKQKIPHAIIPQLDSSEGDA